MTARLLALFLAAVLLAGCGGSSDPAPAYDEAAVEANWGDATTDLTGYCVQQARDGAGDLATAEAAVDRLVNIASAHGDRTYEVDDVTYRQALADRAEDLRDCDAALAAEIDAALE